MAVTVWTNAAKRMLFELLPNIKVNDKVVGYFGCNWTTNGYPWPEHFTKEEGDALYEKLLDTMIKRKAFPNRLPKSSSAVAMLVQQTVYPANNPAYRKLRHSLRFAAYHAGFMEMRDIMYLEEKATEKHGERIFKG